MKHCVLKSTFIENIFIQCNDSFTIACCRPWFQFKTFQKCFRCQKDVNSTHSKIFQPEPDLKVVELWRLPAQEKTRIWHSSFHARPRSTRTEEIWLQSKSLLMYKLVIPAFVIVLENSDKHHARGGVPFHTSLFTPPRNGPFSSVSFRTPREKGPKIPFRTETSHGS